MASSRCDNVRRYVYAKPLEFEMDLPQCHFEYLRRVILTPKVLNQPGEKAISQTDTRHSGYAAGV
jgi:hypothetical protein